MKRSYTSLLHRSGEGKNIVLLTSTADSNGSLYSTLDALIRSVAPQLNAQLTVYAYDPLKITGHALHGALVQDVQNDLVHRLHQHTDRYGPIDQLLMSFHGVKGRGELVLTNDPKTGERVTLSAADIEQMDHHISFSEKANVVLNYCNAGPDKIAQSLSNLYHLPLEAPAHIYYGGFCAADENIVLASKKHPTPEGDQTARSIAHPNGEEYLVFYPSRKELFDKQKNQVWDAEGLCSFIPTTPKEENLKEVYDMFMKSGSINTGEKLLERNFVISDCKDASYFMDTTVYTPQKR